MADTEREIFAEAMSDAPAVETPEVATEEVQAEPAQGTNRDPATGKFVAKAGEAQAEPEATQQPEQRAEQQDHRIPLAEHLREREERQNAQRERDDYRKRLETMERELTTLRQPKAEQQAPDPYADPQAFRDVGIREALTPLEKRLEDQRLATSEMLATDKFGQETVANAFKAMETALNSDPSARFEYQRIMASRHPYAELVAWDKRQSAMKEVGSDPAAYKAKLREENRAEFLKDPEVIQQVLANARQQAAGGARPNTITKLPPSLNSVTAAASSDESDGDVSEAGLFKEAMRR